MEESALARGKDQLKCGVLQAQVHAVEVTQKPASQGIKVEENLCL